MPDRLFPVRPHLDQLKHQAKDLLRAVRAADPAALAEFGRNRARPVEASDAKLADAQSALARSYGFPSWPRMVQSCRMTAAIWRGDVEEVRNLVLRHPRLLHESAARVGSNWGPPMSYAANVGQDAIIDLLRGLGANDLEYAFERACLQGRLGTARHLYAMGARPVRGSVMGPCETLSAPGLELLLDLGAEFCDREGDALAPLACLLQTYSRGPRAKHECFELLSRRGFVFADTPPLATHRGRLDLLERHLAADPQLFSRTYSHSEIYPPNLGCDPDPTYALHGTPLAGGTLLHLCVDYDELEIAEWILRQGGDANVRAAVDREGFGGHTALFGCVVSQPYRANCRFDDRFAQLLLDHGAEVNVRASLRKSLRFTGDDSLHEYRDVTPLGWGQAFHDQDWVSPAVMQLLAARGATL